MSFVRFTVFEEGSEDEDSMGPQFSNIIEEEEYEPESWSDSGGPEDPRGFEGFQKGFSEETETPEPAPRPWDPSEPAWAVLDAAAGGSSTFRT
jgi:hypothetical protein